ncbi:hypothetical protein [Chryseobacterium indologenes]|uniref:Uncharacterized protein n=1 Tax=Chryseobacterium indologenes TaxID=253 RepID=A0A0N0ZVG9_CHRID|nr:hypothetical protein [Chryseobacterium indologenes]KPE51240.1 hypothetical protein AOB46_11280 [Chryseobacterium indologenes]
MSNELKIRIVRDSQGNDLDLNRISIEAADALNIFIDSLSSFAKTYDDTSGIKMRLDNGSVTACLVLPDDGANIADEIEEIMMNRSQNNERIKPLKTIQDKIQQNGSVYEVYLKKNSAQEINVTNYFKGDKFQTRRQQLNRVYAIEFIKGNLYAIGGKKNPNVHIEDLESNTTSKISCSVEAAKVLNKGLYEEMYFSTIRTESEQGISHSYVDNYSSLEDFQNFKTLHETLLSTDSIEKYDIIYDYILEVVNNEDRSNEEIIKLMTLYNNKFSEKGIVRTILMTLKPIIERETGLIPHYQSLVETFRSRSKTGKI